MSGWEDVEREFARIEQESAREGHTDAILMAVLFGVIGYLLAFLVLLPAAGWFFQWANNPTISVSAVLALGGAYAGARYGVKISR